MHTRAYINAYRAVVNRSLRKLPWSNIWHRIRLSVGSHSSGDEGRSGRRKIGIRPELVRGVVQSALPWGKSGAVEPRTHGWRRKRARVMREGQIVVRNEFRRFLRARDRRGERVIESPWIPVNPFRECLFAAGTNAVAHANLLQCANSCSHEKGCRFVNEKKKSRLKESIVYIFYIDYVWSMMKNREAKQF